MSVIKAKSVDISKIDICSPKTIIDGKSFTFNLLYDNSECLTVQLPRCQVFTGLYESDGKCYCEIAIPNNGLTNKLYFDIAVQLENIFRNEKKMANLSFLGHMRKVIDDFSCLRLKLPQNRSKVTTEVVSKENDPVSFSKFMKGSTIIPIVSIDYVYVINETIGFNLLLKQVVIVD